MKRFSTILASFAIILSFASCMPEPAKEPALDELVPETTTLPPTAVSTPAPRAIPTCDQLVDLAALRAIGGSDRWELWPHDEGFTAFSHDLMGPKAQTALASSKQRSSCQWAIPNSGAGIDITVAELSPESSESLVADLRASDYVEGSISDAVITFDYEVVTPAAPVPIHYLFAGNVWIVSTSLGGDEVAQLALDSLISANPDLLQTFTREYSGE